MPRQSRIDAPGALHHLIIRGIERKAIFKDDADRYGFIERIESIFSETDTPCFAWALMSNHVHLLTRTAQTPLATLMRRLLTGYAVAFNRRHHRHGHLFQNRYKSILCQEDAYLLELTRYIHLNPLRAGIVKDIDALNVYPFTGHSVIMGIQDAKWQNTEKILGMFAKYKKTARRKYREFVEGGIDAGRRPELVGGGLIRSVGGWKQAKILLKGQERVKGDERILGDTDFVQDVLNRCNENYMRKYRLAAQGVELDTLSKGVAAYFNLTCDRLYSPGRYPAVVQARSVLCFLAVRQLGLTATELARKIGLTQPAISISVKRGEGIVKERRFDISDFLP
ncbi:transposase [Desulfosarcina alkanivorans]|uniref:Transposase n=1 Tax=Desulfosarcina alkanivorans TaxID=571177 RepID=A0A5K7YU63_9BACT|nr:transposase [Desulfosarcina alkanivorans]BBO72168.1 transposase [Desulfosarcina alkanivorans]BBO72175.1 transposase [Desulfosarcina alkanivorans]BBO72188.1 transposase [Desulfosarcina alkanivorans]BBO72200.1 transposase [Desulfosarcina alkanivorans]